MNPKYRCGLLILGVCLVSWYVSTMRDGFVPTIKNDNKAYNPILIQKIKDALMEQGYSYSWSYKGGSVVFRIM